MKKIIGFTCWLIAFLIPAHWALLETDGVSNMPGLFAFVSFVVLVFAGYWFVDSAPSKTSSEGHGH